MSQPVFRKKKVVKINFELNISIFRIIFLYSRTGKEIMKFPLLPLKKKTQNPSKFKNRIAQPLDNSFPCELSIIILRLHIQFFWNFSAARERWAEGFSRHFISLLNWYSGGEKSKANFVWGQRRVQRPFYLIENYSSYT